MDDNFVISLLNHLLYDPRNYSNPLLVVVLIKQFLQWS